MRTLVVYYSRTGNTRKVAQALGNMLGATLVEIRCDRYRPGMFRYLRATYDSVRGNLPPIELPPALHEACDQIVIGGPVWASHAALPIRALLAGHMQLPNRVALFLTHAGTPPEPAFAEMEARLPRPAAAKLALKERDIKADRISDALGAFAAQLQPV